MAESFSAMIRRPSAFSAAMMSSNSTRRLLLPIARAGVDLDGDRFEHEIRGVNLAMGMRIRDADHFALVLEDQHVVHFRPVAQLAVLLLANIPSSARISSAGNSASVVLWSGL